MNLNNLPLAIRRILLPFLAKDIGNVLSSLTQVEADLAKVMNQQWQIAQDADAVVSAAKVARFEADEKIQHANRVATKIKDLLS